MSRQERSIKRARMMRSFYEESSEGDPFVKYQLDGIIYCIPRRVIEEHPDSVLAQCLEVDTEPDPKVIIERDSTYFAFVIKYLIGDPLDDIELTLNQVTSLEKEADFYGLTKLVEYCQNRRMTFIKEENKIIHLVGPKAFLHPMNNVRKRCVLILFEVIRRHEFDDMISKLAEICGENNCPTYYVEEIPLLKMEDKKIVNKSRFVVLWDPNYGYILEAVLDEMSPPKSRSTKPKNDSTFLARVRMNLYAFMVEIQRKLR